MLTAYYSYSEKKTTIFDDKKLSKIESHNKIKYNNKSKNDEDKIEYDNNNITKEWREYINKFNVIYLNIFQTLVLKMEFMKLKIQSYMKLKKLWKK